jgi:hypothetical protein
MTSFRFLGGEIVRLRGARDDLPVGCCGIVWGVYDMSPTLYEASFVTETGEITDMTFGNEDVEEPSDLSLATFPEKLDEIRTILKRYGR